MNNNTFIHKYLRSLITKEDVCCDMTMGNGNDTLFLARLSKKVYGFDIAAQAIETSKKRLEGFDNVTFILDSYTHVDAYIKEKVHLFIFNLGYLPHSDTFIATKAQDTLIAFQKAYDLLEDNGYLVITFYLGHPGGKDEYYLLDDYIKKNRFPILETYRQYRHYDEPVTYILKKDYLKAGEYNS